MWGVIQQQACSGIHTLQRAAQQRQGGPSVPPIYRCSLIPTHNHLPRVCPLPPPPHPHSPVVRAETLRFKEDGVFRVVKDVFLPWYNAYRWVLDRGDVLGMGECVRREQVGACWRVC
jgi:hypothetical protein